MNRKNKNAMRLLKVLSLAVALLLGSFGQASAQDNKQEKVKVSSDEAKAIKKIEEAKSLDEKIKLIGEFVKKYPQSPARRQAAEYIAGQIMQTKNDNQIVSGGTTYLTIFTDPSEADLIVPNMIFAHLALKQHKEAFAAAEQYFSRHPGDVAIRLQLAIEGSNQMRMGSKDFAAPSREYAARAIELIEADKKPADIADAQWSEYKTKWLPQLYQTLGVLDFFAGDKEKARVNLEKATTIDSSDINSWVFLSSMVDEEYQALALKFNAATPGAERDETLKKANEKMDQVIDMYARIVALTDGKPEAKQINENARENLKSYYQYRHKSLDGLDALIGKYKK